MSEEFCTNYDDGDIVWVKLGPSWWPGEVKDLNNIPPDEIEFKKPPLVVVKFFEEDTYEYVRSWTNIYPYNSEKKTEFIKKGMAAFRSKAPHMEKFPKDVATAEVRIGGNPNILSDPALRPEVRRNYVAEVFGSPSSKKKGNKDNKKNRSPTKSHHEKDTAHITHRRFLGLDDYKAYICEQYPGKDRIPGDSEDEEVIRINTEPEQEFNCHSCSYSTKRIDVMILHTKSHIQGVYVSSPKRKRPSTGKPKKKEHTHKQRPAPTWSDDASSDEIPEPPKEKKRKTKHASSSPKKPAKVVVEEVKPKKVIDIRSDLLAEWEDTDDDDINESPLQQTMETTTTSQLLEILNDTPDASKMDESFDAPDDVNLDETETQNGDKDLSEIEVGVPELPELPENNTQEEPKTQTKAIPKPIMDKETQDSIKSCFDFDEEEEEDLINTNVAVGRKIPRVIPPTEKRKSEILDDIIDLEEEGINKDEILKVSQSFNENRTDGNELESAFKDLMEEVAVPKLPEVDNSLKPTQNFHCVKTIKFPDKPDESPKKDRDKNAADAATKLINPKKRFVKSFEDFENQLHKEEMRRKEEEDLKRNEVQELPNTCRVERTETILENKSCSSDDDSGGMNLCSLQSTIMEKIIEEAKINDESKNRIMSKIHKKRTPRSKILDSYYSDTNREVSTSLIQPETLQSSSQQTIVQPESVLLPNEAETTLGSRRRNLRSSLDINHVEKTNDKNRDVAHTDDLHSTEIVEETYSPTKQQDTLETVDVEKTFDNNQESIVNIATSCLTEPSNRATMLIINLDRQESIIPPEETSNIDRMQEPITPKEDSDFKIAEATPPRRQRRSLRHSAEPINIKKLNNKKQETVAHPEESHSNDLDKEEMTTRTRSVRLRSSLTKSSATDAAICQNLESTVHPEKEITKEVACDEMPESSQAESSNDQNEESVTFSEDFYVDDKSEESPSRKQRRHVRHSSTDTKSAEKTIRTEVIVTPEDFYLGFTKKGRSSHRTRRNLLSPSLDIASIEQDTAMHSENTFEIDADNEETPSRKKRRSLADFSLDSNNAESNSKKEETIKHLDASHSTDTNKDASSGKKRLSLRKSSNNEKSDEGKQETVFHSVESHSNDTKEEEAILSIQPKHLPELGCNTEVDDKEIESIEHRADANEIDKEETILSTRHRNLRSSSSETSSIRKNVDKQETSIMMQLKSDEKLKVPFKKSRWSRRMSHPKKYRKSFEEDDAKTETLSSSLISATEDKNMFTGNKDTGEVDNKCSENVELTEKESAIHRSDSSKIDEDLSKQLGAETSVPEQSSEPCNEKIDLEVPPASTEKDCTTQELGRIEKSAEKDDAEIPTYARAADDEHFAGIITYESVSDESLEKNTAEATVEKSIVEVDLPEETSLKSRVCEQIVEGSSEKITEDITAAQNLLEEPFYETISDEQSETSDEINTVIIDFHISDKPDHHETDSEFTTEQHIEDMPAEGDMQLHIVEDGVITSATHPTVDEEENLTDVLAEKNDVDVSPEKNIADVPKEEAVVTLETPEITSNDDDVVEKKEAGVPKEENVFEEMTNETNETEEMTTNAANDNRIIDEVFKEENVLVDISPQNKVVSSDSVAEISVIVAVKNDSEVKASEPILDAILPDSPLVNGCKVSNCTEAENDSSTSISVVRKTDDVKDVINKTFDNDVESDAINSDLHSAATSEFNMLCSTQGEEFSVGNTSLELPEDAIYEPTSKPNRRKRGRRKSARYTYKKKRKQVEGIAEDKNTEMSDEESVEVGDTVNKDSLPTETVDTKGTSDAYITTDSESVSTARSDLKSPDREVHADPIEVSNDNNTETVEEDTIFEVTIEQESNKSESMHDTPVKPPHETHFGPPSATHVELPHEIHVEPSHEAESLHIEEKCEESEVMIENQEPIIAEVASQEHTVTEERDETREPAAVVEEPALVVDKEQTVTDEPVTPQESLEKEPDEPEVTQESLVIEDTEPVTTEQQIVFEEPIELSEQIVTEEEHVAVDEPLVIEEPLIIEESVVTEEPVTLEEPVTEESIVTHEETVAQDEPIKEQMHLMDTVPKLSDAYTFSEELAHSIEAYQKHNRDPRKHSSYTTSDSVLDSLLQDPGSSGSTRTDNEKHNFGIKLEPKKSISFGDMSMDEEDEKLTDLVSDIVQKLNRDESEKNQEDLDIELEEEMVDRVASRQSPKDPISNTVTLHRGESGSSHIKNDIEAAVTSNLTQLEMALKGVGKRGDRTNKTKEDDSAEHSKEVEILCASSSDDTFKFCIQTNLSNLSRSEEISAIALATLSEMKTDVKSTEIGPKPDLMYPEKLSDTEMVAMESNLTVMSEKDLADAQVEITTNKIISCKKPVTLSNFSMDFSDSASDSGSLNEIPSETITKYTDFDSKGTEFTSRAMTKELKPKASNRKTNAYDQCELLDILEGTNDADKKVVAFKTPTKSFIGDICDFEEHIPSQIVCTKQFKQDLDDEFKKKDKSSVMSTTSKLLERLTEMKSDVKKEASTEMAKSIKLNKAKLVPIILSEQIIRPASDPKKVIPSDPKKIIPPSDPKKVISPSNNTVNDIEDVEAFVIHKDVKKHVEVPEKVSPVKNVRKSRLKPAGKAKILQQTIISPSGEIIQPVAALSKKKTILVNAPPPSSSITTRITEAVSPIVSNQIPKPTTPVTPAVNADAANQDDNVFDIFNMPIVLSDQILTPESIENMPIVIDTSTPVTKPTQTLQTTSTTKLVPSKVVSKVVTTATPAPMPSKALMTSPKLTKPRILQSPAPKPSLSIPTGVLPRTAKPGKYILVSQGTSGVPQQKYLTKKAVMKKTSLPASIASKIAGAPQGIGHKIMVVTNQQGQQQRLLLTPAQQKVLGYQSPVGPKLAKTVVKSNILQKNILSPVPKADAAISSPSIIGQKIIATASQILSGTSTPRNVKTITKRVSPIGQKQSATPSGKTPKTILITNKHGQTIKKIATTEDDIDKQVAEQLEAIKASSGMQFSSTSKSETLNSSKPLPKTPVRRAYSKKQEPKLKISPAFTKTELSSTPPPLISTFKKAIPNVVAETKKLVQEESKPLDRPLKQVLIQDALGNQTTITEGQILALPSETVDGQPQSYMLVTLDQTGNLAPLNNEALMSLDPNLGLGGDLSNMVLQIDQGAMGSGNINQRVPLAQPATVKITNPGEELQAGTSKIDIPRATAPLSLPVATDAPHIEPNIEQNVMVAPTETSINIESIVSNSNGEQGQQLIVTGDPIATQKFLESLTEGTTDLANIIANAEGKSILIQADGQQILINTNSDNQMLTNVAESTEGGGNPIFGTQPNKNTDILAAALADTDVFTSQPKITSQLSPNNALYPINVGNVLETSLTLNSPIMTPLEVPSTNNKKIDDEVDILTRVPKNVDLPITITDPNIAQTVANQQVALMGNEFHTNLELGLAIAETTITSVSAGLTSPGYSYSLPTLDESDMSHKSFSSSMPLLSDEVEDASDLSHKKSSSGKDDGKRLHPADAFLEESRFTLGGGMCSSLSEPPPEMFDIPEVSAFSEKNANNIPLSLQSTPDPKDDDATDVSMQAESSNEGSCEIPLQPDIVAKSADLSAESEM